MAREAKKNTKKKFAKVARVGGLLSVGDPVVAAKNPDALFRSRDPQLHMNKQVVYRIIKDLLEAGHWDLADKYLTKRYIQHNFGLPSGREKLVRIMSQSHKRHPIAKRLNKYRIVVVVAEGDIVAVTHVVEGPHPRNPRKTFTTTGLDMWRIKGGKADEHWDGTLPPGAPYPPPPEFV